ncbi:uncharacterized protein [Temnothorax nylanderi]|uniref:uncharacterized protein n=1 Tax=Temnothorax nylanderi TaxID=102681 RepID=UPI003A89FADA
MCILLACLFCVPFLPAACFYPCLPYIFPLSRRVCQPTGDGRLEYTPERAPGNETYIKVGERKVAEVPQSRMQMQMKFEFTPYERVSPRMRYLFNESTFEVPVHMEHDVVREGDLLLPGTYMNFIPEHNVNEEP